MLSKRLSLLAALSLGAACSAVAQVSHTLPSDLAPAGAPVLLAKEGGTGSVFSEGVAADWAGNVYFNQQDTQDRTMILKVGSDTAKAWRKASDDPNGMWLDSQNRLVICQQNAIVRVKAGETWDSKTDTLYKYPSGTGQAFNDVTGDSKDNLYFTNFQGQSVYFRNAATGETKTVLTGITGASNGIEWDEERKLVYLHAHYTNKVMVYTVADDYSLTNPREFASVSLPDGITLDEHGNVYVVCYNDSLIVFNPAGQKLGKITGFKGQQNTNLAFGGPDFKTLYMVTNKGLYKLPMNVKGYKSGNYSVSLRRTLQSPAAGLRRNKAILYPNGIFVRRYFENSTAILDVNGRVVTPLRREASLPR